MKHKGFTLIELMGVFVVLALILLMTIPQIMSSIKNSADQEIEQFKNTLYVAAENYIAEYDIKAPTTISVETLVKSGFLKSSLINPKTNKRIDYIEEGKSGIKGAVKITKTDNKYSYIYNDTYDTDNLKLPETIEVGKTIVFCGRSWWVLAQDTNTITLMLNGSAGTGRYGSRPYNNSIAKREMERWIKNDPYLSELLALNKIVADNDNIVRLIRKSDIDILTKAINNISFPSYPFWIDNAVNPNAYNTINLGLKNGKTAIIQDTQNEINKGYLYQGYRSSPFPTPTPIFWATRKLQETEIDFSSRATMSTVQGNYYYFEKQMNASSNIGTALKGHSFNYCGGATRVCDSNQCYYASSSGCGYKYIYESLSGKSIYYIPVIKVKNS